MASETKTGESGKDPKETTGTEKTGTQSQNPDEGAGTGSGNETGNPGDGQKGTTADNPDGQSGSDGTSTKKEGEGDEKGETEVQKPFDRKTATFDEIAKEYSQHYPSCKSFHITADRMVFLATDQAAAKEHAQGLKDKTVHTVKIK